MFLYYICTGMAPKRKSADSQAIRKVAKVPGQGVRLTSQSRKTPATDGV